MTEQTYDVLHESGYPEARHYGANERDGVGGTGSVFLLLDEPEVYGLPPDPVVPKLPLKSPSGRKLMGSSRCATARSSPPRRGSP